MANIDSQINDRMQMYAGNPQGLMQRYSQTQELVDLLALQKMKNDRAAATNAVQGAMQPPPGTVKGQLEQEAMQGARNDVLRSMAPGIQQQGQRSMQMQNRPAMGLPGQAAPNLARMAMGGIVGYQDGGDVMGGQVKGYAGPDGSLVKEDEAIIPLGALFELIGRGRDALFSPSRATQEAREIRRGEVEQASERGVNLLNVLPPSQGLTPEQLASFDKYDVTGAVPTKIVEERRERVESGEAARDLAQQAVRRAEANAARREGRSTIPQNEGVTADMYMMPKEELTMAQKLMQLPKVPREAEAEKGGLDIDFRALREFLAGGAGQTSTAGALASGAQRLGAYQSAEQAREDKIQQAVNELQLKRDLAEKEGQQLLTKLAAEYGQAMDQAEYKIAQDELAALPLNTDYLRDVAEIEDRFSRSPVELRLAKERLRTKYIEAAVEAARGAVQGTGGGGSMLAGDAGIVG
jgi:hypothetical protein